MSKSPPTLRHNGVGIADMYSPEEYDRIMAGDDAPNQTPVLSQSQTHGRGSRGLLFSSKFLNNIIYRDFSTEKNDRSPNIKSIKSNSDP